MGKSRPGTIQTDTLKETYMADYLLQFTRLYDLLGRLANEVREKYAGNLVESGRFASGNLVSTLSAEVEVNGTTFTAVLNLLDYWEWVEKGTNPHYPPYDAILNWVLIKPVIPRPDSRGRIPSPEQLAHAIQHSIGLHGTEGTHDLERAENEVLPNYEALLLEALERDTLEYIEKVLA
jgi:hypothetical protein